MAKALVKMKGINLGASPEPFLPPQAAGYLTRKGIKVIYNYDITADSLNVLTQFYLAQRNRAVKTAPMSDET